MNLVTLATEWATDDEGATVQMTTTPALPYREAVLCINTSANYDRTIKVETSGDGTTWEDVSGATIAGANKPDLMMSVVLGKYMRVNQTATGTAGSASVYLLV